jgi:glycosyltransferase involved in cell wall biosynthesis
VTEIGSLDGSVHGTARGWAYDPDQPDAGVAVELSLDGKPFVTLVANGFRDDLMNAGFGNGCHAFSITLPPEYLDGKTHLLSAKFAATEVALSGSPREVAHTDPQAVPAFPQVDRQLPRLAKKQKHQSVPKTTLVSDSLLDGISVIIPTYNRAEALEETLQCCREATLDANVEFIVIDDGSTDDTPKRLTRMAQEIPNLRWTSIPNGGPGQARNVGALMARYELILFQGDDIRPSCESFYRHHLNAHRAMPSIGVAVLGKITWPETSGQSVTFVMKHVQGQGQLQFAYYSMTPYSWFDWRYFYTSNVSLKKSAVGDWSESGFNRAFRAAAWEDCELAYRLQKQSQDGFRMIFIPAAAATHHHTFDVSQFIERQITVGSTARTFLELHPEVAHKIGVSKLLRILASANRQGGQCDHLISMIEGIKAWPKVIEQLYRLGSQSWHADLLTAVFELCYLQGVVISYESPNANYSGAYAYLLERFQERMAKAASLELFGRFPSFTLA